MNKEEIEINMTDNKPTKNIYEAIEFMNFVKENVDNMNLQEAINAQRILVEHQIVLDTRLYNTKKRLIQLIREDKTGKVEVDLKKALGEEGFKALFDQ